MRRNINNILTDEELTFSLEAIKINEFKAITLDRYDVLKHNIDEFHIISFPKLEVEQKYTRKSCASFVDYSRVAGYFEALDVINRLGAKVNVSIVKPKIKLKKEHTNDG